MSDKNKINEIAEDEKKHDRCKLDKIKSICMLKGIFDYFNPKSLYRVFEHKKVLERFNENSIFKDKTVIGILEKRAVTELKKWFPYLKYMYRSLSEIANKLSDSILRRARNYNDRLAICEVECIESVVHLLTVELVFCIMYRNYNEAGRDLSNKISSKLQNKDEKIQKETIEFSIINDEIKAMIGFDGKENYIKNKNLYNVICDIVNQNHTRYKHFSCVEPYGGFEDKVIEYAKSITKENKLHSFWDNLYGVFLRLTCLNDENRNYITKRPILVWTSGEGGIQEYRKKRRKQFDKRLIFKLNINIYQKVKDKEKNYEIFVYNLKQDNVFSSLVFGPSDYDIRNYPDPDLLRVIEAGLSSQSEKDKFQQLFGNEYKRIENVTEEESKQTDKQEKPKQEKEKEQEKRCQIF